MIDHYGQLTGPGPGLAAGGGWVGVTRVRKAGSYNQAAFSFFTKAAFEESCLVESLRLCF